MDARDGRTIGKLFSYVDLEQRVPAQHPLRAIRGLVNEALSRRSGEIVQANPVPEQGPQGPARAPREFHEARRSTIPHG